MALGGPTAQAAETFLKAVPSWQKIYLDGQEVQMTAYNINGSNYVKLRDIGKAVGFNVYWDTAANGVQIDSDAPYTGEAPPRSSLDTINVGSYKGVLLKVGDRSGLIISPNGSSYAVTSSDLKVVSIENVSGFWIAVAKSPGTATITVTGDAGKTGSLTLTVSDSTLSTNEAPSPTSTSTAELDEVRQEIIRLANNVRRENGVAELPVNDALMNAAQICSERLYTWHHTKEECEAVMASGYPNGFGTNLTVFTSTADAAQHAIDNWSGSPGHFQTMIDPNADGIGVGVTQSGGVTYCYMFIGKPNSVNPYG